MYLILRHRTSAKTRRKHSRGSSQTRRANPDSK
ncbi:hypothetical protein TSAR_013767 [Trichomalopsis sarcophagae]|uniref:Uncharacterized protein n=1 Tax=Trichomalopsis sarcophagae TaxID=543379 RepID=A0A232FN96_9HYME|nr:hypothetical protein TSAR_013767 [Trichomalopsis sarcophagae]